MRREFHVRFCEGGGVRFLSATRLVLGFQHESDARRFLAGGQGGENALTRNGVDSAPILPKMTLFTLVITFVMN